MEPETAWVTEHTDIPTHIGKYNLHVVHRTDRQTDRQTNSRIHFASHDIIIWNTKNRQTKDDKF